MCCPAASTVGFLDCARGRPFFILIFIVFVLSGMLLEVGVFEEVDTFKVQVRKWYIFIAFLEFLQVVGQWVKSRST